MPTIPYKNIYRADLEVIKGYRSGSSINKAYRSGELIYYKLNYSEPTPPDYRSMPLTFKVISGGTISWRANSSAYTKEIQYSINDGPWVSITSTTAGVPISLNTGDIVKFKGDGAISTSSFYINRFRDSTIVFEVYGNIMSLIDSTGYATATTAADHSFRSLFELQTGLTSVENLVLPATTIGTNAYKRTFSGCTSLTTAPSVLPATVLTESCYSQMFQRCTSLTSTPSLPATTMASQCYSYMFAGCTGLTSAPELPATTLVQRCYEYMFSGCTSLNYIKCLATDISAFSCTRNWVSGVSSSGTFVKANSMKDWEIDSTNGIPSGWTVQNEKDYSKEYLTFNILSAGTIMWKTFDSALTRTIEYKKNEGNWTSITSSTDGVSIPVDEGDTIQFKGDNATYATGFRSFNTFSGTTAKFEVEGNIMSLIDSTNFAAATTLASSYTFESLFYQCTGLTSAENLILPATTLIESCYRNMFSYCTSLTTAPELPATTLADWCYSNMFYVCTSLNYIKCLATNISATYCTNYWVSNVSSSGTFVTPSSTNWSTGENGIPSGWTRVDA